MHQHITKKKYSRKCSGYICQLTITLLVISLALGGFTLYKTDKNQGISLYLMPVGEGLSLLIQTPEMTVLYDTGNRFGAFDAGRNIILPLLNNIQIPTLDTIILSVNNQQHTGGARAIRESFPNAVVIGPSQLSWLIDDMVECRHYQIDHPHIQIEPLLFIQSSCAFKATLYQSIVLYLISDITPQEWELAHQAIIDHNKLHNINETLILYPNQGRKAFSPLIEDLPLPHKIILLSTKTPYTDLSPIKNQEYSSTFYNSYYGAIHIHIQNIQDNKNAKPYRLRIHEYRDDLKYWWLKTSSQ